MMLWLRRWMQLDDRDFNPDMPFGRCAAKWRVPGPIPYVTCGKRTNKKVGEHWACSTHLNPKGESNE